MGAGSSPSSQVVATVGKEAGDLECDSQRARVEEDPRAIKEEKARAAEAVKVAVAAEGGDRRSLASVVVSPAAAVAAAVAAASAAAVNAGAEAGREEEEEEEEEKRGVPVADPAAAP